MITRPDDGHDFDPDDPLTVLLRPDPDYLALTPGRYEQLRRGAARRRMLRVAVGVGLSGVVAALVALPLYLADPGSPATPVAPLAPPPAGRPSTRPTSSLPTPAPATTRPTKDATTRATTRPTATPGVPTTAAPTTAVPTATAPPRTAPTPTTTAPPRTGGPPAPRTMDPRR